MLGRQCTISKLFSYKQLPVGAGKGFDVIDETKSYKYMYDKNKNETIS